MVADVMRQRCFSVRKGPRRQIDMEKKKNLIVIKPKVSEKEKKRIYKI